MSRWLLRKRRGLLLSCRWSRIDYGIDGQKQKVVESYTYSSFGEVKRHGDKVKNTFTFTGREWDKEIGLYFYRARYMDPRIGRFISFDPILHPINGPLQRSCNKTAITPSFVDALSVPQKLNPFILTENNPLNLTDSTGLGSFWELPHRYICYPTSNANSHIYSNSSCVQDQALGK